MYLPIPEGVNLSQSVTVHGIKTECGSATNLTVTASFSKPKSTTPLPKKDNIVLNEVQRPTDGSWQQIRDSGSIKMTPMSIRNERVEYSVGQVNVPFISYKTALAGRNVAKVNGVCRPCQGVLWKECKFAHVKGSYVEQGDLDYWMSKYPTAPHYWTDCGELDDAKIEAMKTSVYADLLQSYNLGEELAEIKETIAGVHKLLAEGVSLLLDFRKSIDSLLEKDKVREAGSRWMEFRYGIMPIIYSVQDLLGLKTEGKYATARGTVYPEIVIPSVVDKPSIYFEDVGTSTVYCAITAKARWATQEQKNFDRININPLTTLTAVLPWAMVIRWFFNVQSYLDCRVKSLTSLALETAACVAIREKRDIGTYLHVENGYSVRIIDPGDSGGCGKGYYGITDFGLHEDLRIQDVLLKQYTIDNYRRYLYSPSDVKLVFNPYISWQRSVDAMVLMMGLMSNLLRRLK